MTQSGNEYAVALFMLSEELNSSEKFLSELKTVSSVFSDNPEYMDFLASPGIPKAERTTAIEQAFSTACSEEIVSFLQLLCERGRISELFECITQFEQLFLESKRVVNATVSSAVALTDNEKERLIVKLEKISGKSVIVTWQIDESILGGVIVEIDGKILDGSLKRRLYEVKEVMDK